MKKLQRIFFTILLVSLPYPALAFSCYYEHSPFGEASLINQNDVVLKGKVLKNIEPSFWTKNFSDSVFAYVTVDPIKIYKGTAKVPIEIVNGFYKQDKGEDVVQRRTIGAPPQPQLDEDKIYTLALKYDEKRGLYILKHTCGKLPEFKFLDSLQAIQSIEVPSSYEHIKLASTLKSCKNFLRDETITYKYAEQMFNRNYIKLTPKPFIFIKAKGTEDKEEIQEIFIKEDKDNFAIIGKSEDTYFFFIDCN